MKLFRYLLLVATITLVAFKIYHMSKIDFDIDILNRQLEPVKKYIRPHSTISLFDNYQYSGIFMSAEYILAPAIVVQNPKADTLLLIQSKQMGIKAFANYRSIFEHQDGDRVISLITRIK